MGHIKPAHILISSSNKSITYDPIPIILILANSVNLIGCIEVCYRVYYKKCRIGEYRSLPLDSKFSLYIAVSSMYIFKVISSSLPVVIFQKFINYLIF
jgi:hypothetical protein